MNVKQCAKCEKTTEYYCHHCHEDLCRQCKDRHVTVLESRHHEVTVYRERFKLYKTELCEVHTGEAYIKYCELCDLPICFRCTKHRHHQKEHINLAYKIKRQQFREPISYMETETLYRRKAILAEKKCDVKKLCMDITCIREKILKTAKRLKNGLSCVDGKWSQKIITKTRIIGIQKYEATYEKYSNRPVKFIRVCTDGHLTNFQALDCRNKSKQFIRSQIKKCVDAIIKMGEVHVTERKQQQRGPERPLQLMKKPLLQHSFSVKGVMCTIIEISYLVSNLQYREKSYPYFGCFNHISCVGPELAWVSKRDEIILTDLSGQKIHTVVDFGQSPYFGMHTVSSQRDLIYIDTNQNIRKLSADLRTKTTLIRRKKLKWTPRSVHFSPHTGQLLVGMDTAGMLLGIVKCRITRYNKNGKNEQIIVNDISNIPYYLAENSNGDVVVSNGNFLYVTDSCGKHRFSFTGHPEDCERIHMQIYAVCTDIFSNILLCDWTHSTVQMIDKDGQFIMNILTQEHGLHRPRSLSYDKDTHRLWVGSLWNNTVHICKFITRNLAVLDNSDSNE